MPRNRSWASSLFILSSHTWFPSVAKKHHHNIFSKLYLFNPYGQGGQSLTLSWKYCRIAEIDRTLDSHHITCRTAWCWFLNCEEYSNVRFSDFWISYLNHQITLWFWGSVQLASSDYTAVILITEGRSKIWGFFLFSSYSWSILIVLYTICTNVQCMYYSSSFRIYRRNNFSLVQSPTPGLLVSEKYKASK